MRTYLGFPQAAAVSTMDSQLRANLRNATHTIRDKRAAAIGELPDWPGLRAHAKAVKDHTLRNLESYLEQFEAAVVAAGDRCTGPGTPPRPTGS